MFLFKIHLLLNSCYINITQLSEAWFHILKVELYFRLSANFWNRSWQCKHTIQSATTQFSYLLVDSPDVPPQMISALYQPVAPLVLLDIILTVITLQCHPLLHHPTLELLVLFIPENKSFPFCVTHSL